MRVLRPSAAVGTLTSLLALLLLLPGGALAASPGPPSLGPSPLEPASTGGFALVERALAKLTQHRRLLVVGAHPDDEDTSALARVVRGEGGEAAYLSLSRGEGGQNLIGPELGVELGLLRSRELLAAREIDGARQFFTCAYDFGYTRSLEETFEKWPRAVLLEDAMRVVRRFRPQVIVSVFPEDARAGHGQHQAAGVIAHEVFEVAGRAAEAPPELLARSGADDPGREEAPWEPSALFRATWWDRDATTLTTELGLLDPLTGRSLYQLAMASRSQHRSQDMGRIQPLGPAEGRYAWVAGPGGPESDGLFAGIDTRLEAIAALLPEGEARETAAAELAAARRLAETARAELTPGGLERAAHRLVTVLGRLRAARRAAASAPEGAGAAAARTLLDEKLEVAQAALAAAAGVAFDAWTETGAAIPGFAFRVDAQAWHASRGPGAAEPEGDGAAADPEGGDAVDPEGSPLRACEEISARSEGVIRAPLARRGDAGIAGTMLRSRNAARGDAGAPAVGPEISSQALIVEPVGVVVGGPLSWEVEPARDEGKLVAPAPGPLAAGELAAWGFYATAPQAAPPTIPYFLERPLDGALYDWSVAPPEVRGEPFGPPPLTVRFLLRIGGEEVAVEREVVQRVADQAVGEVRRPLRVVPRLEVEAEPELAVWSTADAASEGSRAGALEVAASLRSNAPYPLAGRLRLEVPAGWPEPEPLDFEIAEAGGETAARFRVRPPEDLPRGRYALRAVADLGMGVVQNAAYPRIDYPHVRPTPYPRPAAVEVAAADIRAPALDAVGFVVGASDRVPRDLAAVGVPVETLTGRQLGERDLGRYDAIVVGSRAYETDPALARANGRLLDYARAGGLVIVLYQQYPFFEGGHAPYPLEVGRPHDRVSDEEAPVVLLRPDHPAFTTPNPIGPEDWNGWVQERGLYFAHSWDETYTALLEFPAPAESAGAGDGAEEERGDGLRGGLLVAPVGEGTWVYTGLAFFRQLPAGVTGAYRLLANLLALGGEAAGGAGSGRP